MILSQMHVALLLHLAQFIKLLNVDHIIQSVKVSPQLELKNFFDLLHKVLEGIEGRNHPQTFDKKMKILHKNGYMILRLNIDNLN